MTVKQEAKIVSSKEFKNWPLSVDSGMIGAIELIPGKAAAVIFILEDGTTYALNGIAKDRGIQPIDPIWNKQDHDVSSIEGLLAASQDTGMGELIDFGLSLVEQS